MLLNPTLPMNPKITKLSSFLGLFFITVALGYLVGSYLIPASTSLLKKSNTKTTPLVSSTPAKSGFLTFEGPKTETCPINGVKYTTAEKDLWSTRRPLLVMIENHQDARPQSGLQNADIVYEGMSEGGISRFMGVFYCAALREAEEKYDLGPVRSARTHFVEIASEYSDYPLYAHVGGANCSSATPGGPCTTSRKVLALEQISQYGWTSKGTWGDLNEFALSYKVCRREPERTGDVRDTEHTMYCSSKELWNIAADRGLTNETLAKKQSWDKNFISWKFTKADKSEGTGGVSYGFWKDQPAYDVLWKYNLATNDYSRFNGGKAHIDFNTQETLVAKNIVVMEMKEEKSIDEHFHNYYYTTGTGKGFLYQNGAQTEITWSKKDRTSRTLFKDKTGKDVELVPGLTWVVMLPNYSTPVYESGQ